MAKLMAADGSSGGGATALADGDQTYGVGAGSRVRFLSDYAAASSQQPQPQSQLQPEPQMPLSTGGVTSTEAISASPSTALDREREPAYAQRGALRRPRRRSAHLETPYERPATGRHAAAGPQAASLVGAANASGQVTKAGGGGRGAWLGSGFSKIITNGATYLYSSIFRRPLAPPLRISSFNPPVQVATVEEVLLEEDEQPSSSSLEAQKDDQAGNGPVDVLDGRDHSEPEMANSSLSDVENLLKQKTLSRDEFDRLTALLQSRVVSNGVENRPQQQQPKHVQFDLRTTRQEIYPSTDGSQSEAQRWRQDLQKAREERENGIRTLAVYENGRPSPATPAARAAERVDALSSSPVEVAIAYMGGRPLQLPESSPVEPLNQRDENRVSRGALPSPSPRLTHTALTKWSGPEILNDDQFRTPPPPSVHSWSRNQRISRTPYSRPLRLQAPRENAVDGTFGTPSASRWTPIRTPLTGGREMLKRRSTVLDDGWSSGGPIRRTRHKAIVSGTPSRGAAAFPSTPVSVTPSNLSHSRGSAFPLTPVSGARPSALTSPIGALHLGTPSGRNIVSSAVSANQSIPDSASRKDLLAESGNFYVPAQASATARKILETLEKMTPSPKGSALGEELAHVRDRPPTPLTEGMLNDQARKSMTTVEFSLPIESREPGPSSRNVNESSPQQPSLGGLHMSNKGKGKGKASGPPAENGPVALGGALTGQEGARLVDGPAAAAAARPSSARPRENESALASEAGRSKGFRINANFEESGSEDEGRFAATNRSPPGLPVATSKVPNAAGKGSAAKPPVFMASGTVSPTFTSGAGLSSISSATTSVETLKPASTGFTFPTRVPVEGPPTPKAMSPASTSPTSATPAAPFFQFPQAAEQLVVPGGPADPGGARGKAEFQPSSNTEFAFGAPSAFPSSTTLPIPKLQMPLDTKASNISKQSSPFFGAPPSNASSPSFPSFSTGATSFSAAATGPKFGDATTAPASSSALKPGAAPSNTSSPFLPSASSPSLFGSGHSSMANVSGMAPSLSVFGSNGAPGTAPPPSTNPFGTSSGSGTSAAVSPGFGQLNSFAFKSPSVTAAVPSTTSLPADTQAPGSASAPGGAKEESTSMPDTERPLKRPVPSFQQEVGSKRQQPAATATHSFTAFGTSVGTSAAFGAGSSSSTTSQGLYPLSTFGQASSSAPQTSSSLPSAAAGSAAAAAPAVPFTFGNPAGSTSAAASSAGFGTSPSFPPFGSSGFGTTSSGSIFGLTPPTSASTSASASAAAPMGFGGSSTTAAAPIFGSAGTSPGFGGFPLESTSQSQAPPSPVFGSGFTSTAPPSSSPAFTFGSSVPSFSFGAGAGSGNSSGSTFAFGSSPSFPFPPPAGKSATPSSQQQQQQGPPSIFGLASSVPAFGSTTNGTMASDVVVNDQSNMDDNSMAEDPSQMGNNVSPQSSSMFNGQSGAGAGAGSSFVFGAQTGAPGGLGGAAAGGAPGGASIFGGFPPSGGAFGAPAANPFAAGAQPPGGSLDFSGGSFTLGSGGDRPQRKFVKARRTPPRRGK